MLNIFLKNEYPLDVNMPSGLFKKFCHECGRESNRSPFHALIIVTYHLAEDGTPKETLFSALACLICLLFCNANPFHKAVLILPGNPRCDHQPMTPLELCEALER